MRASYRSKAHETAVQANAKYAEALNAELKRKESEKIQNLIINRIPVVLGIVLTVSFLLLLVGDSYLMAPILKVVTTEGLSLGKGWTPYIMCAYIVLAIIFSFFIAKGLLKAWKPSAVELEYDLAILASPDKSPAEIRREIKREYRRDVRISIILLVFFNILVTVLALVRNYYLPSHQLAIKVSSPGDITSIFFPVFTANAMFAAGVFKETIIRLFAKAAQVAKLTKIASHYFMEAQTLGQEVIEYENEARSIGENTIRSKEIVEVIERYESISQSTKRQHSLIVKVQNQGVPVSNLQVHGVTVTDEHLYAVTNDLGVVLLGWNVDNFLKRIFIGKFPLEGTRFESGQTLTVELDTTGQIGGLLN